MKITILTLFPEMFTGVLNSSILKRAQAKGLVEFGVRYLRDWTEDKHKTVDDRPYGGGAGMVLKPDVVYRALVDICGIDRARSQKSSKFKVQMSNQIQNPKSKKLQPTNHPLQPIVILPTPKGMLFSQQLAIKYSKKDHLVFVCPHYEGYDERITSFVTDQVSMGEYIVTGGEIPAMMMVDAVVRLVEGVIRVESLEEESFTLKSQKSNLKNKNNKSKFKNSSIPRLSALNSALFRDFEYPHYTRPEVLEVVLRGKKVVKRVPKVLLSGNHQKIQAWREQRQRRN